MNWDVSIPTDNVIKLHDVGAFAENWLGGGLCKESQVGNILLNSWA